MQSNTYIKYKQKNHRIQIGGHNTNILTPTHDDGNGDAKVKRRLALVEQLNFEGANKFDEKLIRQIYDPNVTVIIANVTTTKGIDNQLKMIKSMYDTAPDIKIKTHGIQFGSGDYTAVEQFMEGTFTGPMEMPDGTFVQPTGKEFKITALSILKWNDNDRIIEERVYSDDKSFMEQLGINKCIPLYKQM